MSTTRPRQLRELPPTAPPAGTGVAAQRERTGERPYFCRGCLMVQRGRWVPTGWYTVERSVGGGGKARRLGLYCSAACIIASKDKFEAGEAAHDRLIGLTEHAGQRAERLVQVARTLLYDGQMTLRQVGDELDVPTKALRELLTRAGVEIPDPPAPAPAAEKTSDPDKPALVVINELTHSGRVRDVAWSADPPAGPAHEPVFTVRVTAQARTPDGGYLPVQAEAEAASKAAARAVAGAALLAALPAEKPA